MLNKDSKIYIAGHNGMVGSACWRTLSDAGYTNLIGKSSKELDLRNQSDVKDFLADEKPHAIIDAAAKVGGILANITFPVNFLMNNLTIQSNVIKASHKANVARLIFLGSSCIYPKNCPQPIKEEYLLTSELEATNRPYALAKIAGIEMCWSYNRQFNTQYLAAMPTNLYGPNDNYDLETSHVLPALIRKIHEAKLKNSACVEIWGTGTPKREFLHVDDLASSLVHLINLDHKSFIELTNSKTYPLINIGTGRDLSISDLAYKIKEIVGFRGSFVFNKSFPDGVIRKVLDIEKIKKYGWEYKIELDKGLDSTYKNYLESQIEDKAH